LLKGLSRLQKKNGQVAKKGHQMGKNPMKKRIEEEEGREKPMSTFLGIVIFGHEIVGNGEDAILYVISSPAAWKKGIYVYYQVFHKDKSQKCSNVTQQHKKKVLRFLYKVEGGTFFGEWNQFQNAKFPVFFNSGTRVEGELEPG